MTLTTTAVCDAMVIRYHMEDMKVLCESMLVPSESNWQDILHVSDLINSTTLKKDVMRFLRGNLSLLTKAVEEHGQDEAAEDGPRLPLEEFSAMYPDLLQEIMTMRIQTTPPPPCALYVQKIADNANAPDELASRTLPLWAMAGAAIALYLYAYLSTIVVLGYLVPIINVSALLGMGYYFFFVRIKES